jgi:hypothetical protein
MWTEITRIIFCEDGDGHSCSTVTYLVRYGMDQGSSEKNLMGELLSNERG